MKLGEFIKEYRTVNKLSLRDFAKRSGLSRQYVLNLENGFNNQGKPLSPTLTTYSKVAKAVGMDELELMKAVQDEVTVNPETAADAVMHIFEALSEEGQKALTDYAMFLLQKEGKK